MHRLQISGLALAAFIGGTLSGCAAGDVLVHLESRGARVENGKTLDIRFDEIERTDAASVVEVTMSSGGSVSSSMFVMRGVCAVARARNANWVTSTHIHSNPERYRLVFFDDEKDLPVFALPHRDGKPDRTRPDGISRSMCGLIRIISWFPVG